MFTPVILSQVGESLFSFNFILLSLSHHLAFFFRKGAGQEAVSTRWLCFLPFPLGLNIF